MLRQMLITALAVGVTAGLLVTAVQQVRVMPLILEAEVYERKANPQAEGTATSEGDLHSTAGGRLLVTAAANVLAGLGFGLLLSAAFALHGRETSIPRGMLWGLAGYVVFVAAPALGLPSELPGTPAAQIQSRQLWWLGTVAATLAAMVLIFLTHRVWLSFAGGFLAALPHALGAPHPENPTPPPFPEDMATQFIIASLVTSLVFWLFLGGFAGWLYRRLG